MNAPKYLSKEAKLEWKRITKELERIGILHNADRAILEMYCTTYARYIKLNKKAEDDSNFFDSSTAKVWNLKNTAAELLKYTQQLGLTPYSRRKITQSADKKFESPPKKEDGFEKSMEEKLAN